MDPLPWNQRESPDYSYRDTSHGSTGSITELSDNQQATETVMEVKRVDSLLSWRAIASWG